MGAWYFGSSHSAGHSGFFFLFGMQQEQSSWDQTRLTGSCGNGQVISASPPLQHIELFSLDNMKSLVPNVWRKHTPRENANSLFGWSSMIAVGRPREGNDTIYKMMISVLFAPKNLSQSHTCCSIVHLQDRSGTLSCRGFGGIRLPQMVGVLTLLLGGLPLARN